MACWVDMNGKTVLSSKRVCLNETLSIDEGSLLIARLQQCDYVSQMQKEHIYNERSSVEKVNKLIDIIDRGLTTEKFAAFVVALGEDEVVNNRELKDELIKSYKDNGGVWTQEMEGVFQRGDDRFINKVRNLSETDALKRILCYKRFDLMRSLDIEDEESQLVNKMRCYLPNDSPDRIYSRQTRSARVEFFIDSLIRGITRDRLFTFVDAIGDPEISNLPLLAGELRQLINARGFQ